MKRFVCAIEYMGLGYQGWQSQKGMRTVQSEVELALAKVANEKISVHCAGRTDSGVHSLGQVIHFDTTVSRESFAWVRGVNSYLPRDIRFLWCAETADDFHARYSAVARKYAYFIYNNHIRSAVFDGRLTWIPFALDQNLMRDASTYWVGNKDFAAFQAKGCQSKTSKRTIFEIKVERKRDIIMITVEANSFLQKMVRNLVGTLIEIGAKRRKIDWAKSVLKSRDRSFAGATAPSDGLYLSQVKYPPKFRLPFEDHSFINYFIGGFD